MTSDIRTDRQLIVASMGLAASLLTGLILGLVEVYTGFALYSLSMLFIIPVGAILAGFAAASGYYAGALVFNQKPAGAMLLNMVLTSVSAFLIVHYVPYFLMEVSGVRVKEMVSFWRYLDVDIRSTSLALLRSNADTGELGVWGYGFAAVQLLGFSVGGAAVFGWLSDKPYCDKCSRYLKKTGRRERYTSDGEGLVSNVQQFAALIQSGNMSAATQLFKEEMGSVQQKGHHLKARVITSICPQCNVSHLDFTVEKLAGNDWKEIDDLRITAFSDVDLVQMVARK